MADILAVYGTLRRGGPANGYLRGCHFVCQDTITGSIYDMGRFPAWKSRAHIIPVIVDLYDIPNQEIMESIDRYEGYFPAAPEQSLFVRRRLYTIRKAGSPCWVYEYKHEVEESNRIESGDWFTT